MPVWTWLIPCLALGILALSIAMGLGSLLAIACGVSLVAAVIAAVHHAEVVAHRVGEPFGTLILAIAVTVIEASLILAMTIANGPEAAAVTRDTIYAAVMIICNGVLGICVLVGAVAHREQAFRIEGSSPALAALVTLCTLSLVLPGFTTTTAGGTYSNGQLVFAAVTSAVIWAVYVFVQTVRHRDYFLPPPGAPGTAGEEVHAALPSTATAWISFGLLVLALVGVVGLAKVLSPTIESSLDRIGAPKAVLGIAIALIVLLPETWAAVRAARANRLQTSVNLAFGSALASIGLTIPAVAMVSIALGLPLVLALEPKELVMLTLTFIVSAITLSSGRTHIMQGAVHLVIFAAFLFLALVP